MRKLTDFLITIYENKYEEHQRTTTTDMNSQYRCKHIKNVAELNIFVSAQPSP